jgi:hypothetical protein
METKHLTLTNFEALLVVTKIASDGKEFSSTSNSQAG